MPTLCLFFVLSLSLCAQGIQRSYVSKGRNIVYSVIVFDPPTSITPENGPVNQDSPINCTRLYWSRLSHLDITSAAQLYTDPQSEIEARMKYKERVGEQTFRQKHTSLFSEGERFPYELIIGKQHALVSEKHPGTMLLFIERNGKFWMDNAKPEQRSQQANDLMTLVNAYSDDKLKFH
jgi:hypothetical protein